MQTFNRGVIFIDEVALDQLNCQARFTDAATSYNDELVFSQKLSVQGKQNVSALA